MKLFSCDWQEWPSWRVLFVLGVMLVSLAGGVTTGLAQTQTATNEPTAVVRLRVRPKLKDKEIPQQRKRFYLFPGSLKDNHDLVQQIAKQPVVSRECYYKKIKASDAFVKWLITKDCESVYCRAIDMESVTGPAAVPEFQKVFDQAPKEYRTPELKLNWLTTALPDDIRIGFYRERQAALKTLINAAQAATHAQVVSVMTDRNGTAYFTELRPGTYTISNLLPTEFGANSILWTCEVTIKPDDVTLEKPFLLSNVKSPQTKCLGVETPLPACDVSATVPAK